MRTYRGRICDRFVDYSRFNRSYDTFRNSRNLIDAYGDWIREYVDQAWDGYLFTVMFNHIPGSPETKITQMHQEIRRMYGRLVTRMVRKPRLHSSAPFLPKCVFLPDFPVPKSQGGKSSLWDVKVNGGLHEHGIVLANQFGRLHDPLDKHFVDYEDDYLTENLRHIDVQRINRLAAYTTEYGMKALKRPIISSDHILILPRTLSELPDRIRRQQGKRDDSS
jgi:hypothetical protein